jgi:hypothetical protein
VIERDLARALLVACLVMGVGTGAAANETDSGHGPAIRDSYLQDLWAMARTDREAGRPLDAMPLLKAILEQRPELLRVRLELALVAYEALDLDEARRQCEVLLASPDLSPRVREAVRSFLAKVVDRQESFGRRHEWSPFLALGLVYDDNLNAGPVSDLVEIENELFFVQSRFLPRSDWGWVLRGGLTHRFRFADTLHLGQRPALLLWDSRAVASRKSFVNEKGVRPGHRQPADRPPPGRGRRPRGLLHPAR